MTKKELLEKLEGLPDDTEIRIYDYDESYEHDEIVANRVDVECDGTDGCQAEVLIW